MKLPFDKSDRKFGLSTGNALIKRTFDIFAAVAGLLATGWLLIILIVASRLDTKESGLFSQERIGLFGETFTLYKLRSMRKVAGVTTNVTTNEDPRITRLGRFLRRSKLDELPQMWNVLKGDMSFVGPRPDVAEVFADLEDKDSLVLAVRPGITGPASLHFRNEETLLASVDDPERYNKETIFPKKIEINSSYIENYSFLNDIRIIISTVLGK